MDINKRLTELRIISLHYDTPYRFKLAAHTGGGMGLLNSVDTRTLPEALHLNGKNINKKMFNYIGTILLHSRQHIKNADSFFNFVY